MERETTEVIASCLELFERGDEAGIEDVCRLHPGMEPGIRAALTAARRLGGPPEPPVRPPDTPFRIGPFPVVRLLGRGGSGAVYLVRDPELDRLVALKLLSALVPSEQDLERFDRETKALARLQHPCIVAIHAVGTTPEGAPYFTMDFVEGSSLETLLERMRGRDPHSLSPEDLCHSGSTGAPGGYVPAVARLIARLADALELVHRAQVIHRDVKPGNVLVDLRGEPRLVDFGIARGPGAHTVTRAGMAPGTPLYMAPEQVSGSGAEVGPWTDVFALGVTLYHLLTLRAPFSGRSTLEVLGRIQRDDPLPPRRFNPEVPRDLETIVAKATEKAPARRYPSAAALRDDLEAFLAHRPIQARPARAMTRAVRWTQRHPAKAIASGSAALAALVATGFLLAGLGDLATGDRRMRRFAELDGERDDLIEQLEQEEWRLLHHLDSRERGPIWKKKSDLQALEERCEQAIDEAERAYRAALGIPFLDRPAKAKLALVLSARAEDARRRGELVHASSLAAASREYGKQEIQGLPVSIRADPADTEIHLFRYEPYTSLPGREGQIPRLVPVPVDASGTPLAFPEGGFQPGDLCLVVLSADPAGSASGRLHPGDLILRMDGEEIEDRAWVSGAIPCGPAERAGVQPYDQVVSLCGHDVRRSFEWGMVEWAENYNCQIESPGRGIVMLVGSHDPIDRPEWSGAYLPAGATREYLRSVTCLPIPGPEDVFGITVVGIAGLLTVPPPRKVELETLLAGTVEPIRLSPGASPGLEVEVTAYPLVLTPGNRLDGGTARLAPGSYLAFLRAPGRCEMRLPFVVEDEPVELRTDLPLEQDVPRGFVCVEGGTFRYQGDLDLPYSEPAGDRHVDRFFIARLEITFAEWWEFLEADGVFAEAAAWLQEEGLDGRNPRWERNPPRRDLPVPRLPGEPSPWVPWDGKRWLISGDVHVDSPVVGILIDHVKRYLAWRNRQAAARGEPWRFRLPTAEEWEKSGRGVDGRPYVWGHEFDFSLANSLVGTERGTTWGRTKLEPIGSYPTDESPYGIRDLAGSAAEHNGSNLEPYRSWNIVRGGSWVCSTPLYFRAASLLCGGGDYPKEGFRLVAVPTKE